MSATAPFRIIIQNVSAAYLHKYFSEALETFDRAEVGFIKPKLPFGIITVQRFASFNCTSDDESGHPLHSSLLSEHCTLVLEISDTDIFQAADERRLSDKVLREIHFETRER